MEVKPVGDIAGEDLNALMAFRNKIKTSVTAANGSVTPAPVTAAQRMAADRRAILSENDGRRSRGAPIVRDAQLNFKVPTETKTRWVAIARRMGVSMVDLVDRSLEHWEAEADKTGR
jgi:hypothetical protein